MLNAFGNRVDPFAETSRLEHLETDYENLASIHVRTVREGIRWSHVERSPYVYDWAVVQVLMEAGRRHGIQQLWDICHFGFPDDLTPLHPMFARRFAAVCREFAILFRSIDTESPLIVTPINEVSFLSWLGGDVQGTSPYGIKLGWEVKYALMKAYIEGIEALQEIDSDVRILTTEPLVNITYPHDATTDQMFEAQAQHAAQFQVLDVLSGRLCPELRGKIDYIDLLGFNFYPHNEWVYDTRETVSWSPATPDERWVPLHQLLIDAHRRYRRPLVLSETSHLADARSQWMDEIGRECCAAIQAGVPLLGVCWYPLLDRPDWDRPDFWHEAGIWSRPTTDSSTTPGRRSYDACRLAFLKAQERVGEVLSVSH